MWGSLDLRLWSKSHIFQPTRLDSHIFPLETAQIDFFRKYPVDEYSSGRRSAKNRIG